MEIDESKLKPVRNKKIAGILAIFLGGLGVHKYYLGNWIGGLYLLFLPTLIPVLVGIIEGVVLLGKSEAEWNNKYINKQVYSFRALFIGLAVFSIPFIFIGIFAAVFIAPGS